MHCSIVTGQDKALWTLENKSAISSISNTASEVFDYRDKGTADTFSHQSFESQTAMVNFTLNRGGGIINHPNLNFVKTSSFKRNNQKGAVNEVTITIGEMAKEDLANLVEQNL